MSNHLIANTLQKSPDKELKIAIIEFANYQKNKEFLKRCSLDYFQQITQNEKLQIYKEVGSLASHKSETHFPKTFLHKFQFQKIRRGDFVARN